MTVNCIVQARMNSSRLPGKVMMEVDGKPLIGHLLDRLKQCKKIDKIIVAIPVGDAKSALGRYLLMRAEFSIGPEDDVAERFAIALEYNPCDAFVRICADSPLIPPFIVDAAADCEGEYWLMGCFPGEQAERFETQAFLEALPHMKGDEREHLGLYFKRRHSTVVDTQEDFERVKCLISKQQS